LFEDAHDQSVVGEWGRWCVRCGAALGPAKGCATWEEGLQEFVWRLPNRSLLPPV
jgi:hypothetical protein